MKLRARALGLAVGIVWGLGIFVATIWSASLGGGRTLGLLSAYYYGYSVGFGGAIVGLIWGFINGFIFGSAVAWLYNKFHNVIYKTDASGMTPRVEQSATAATR